MHALILREIDDKYAGVYRDRQVYISGSNYYPPPAQQIPGLMEKFVAKTNQCLAAVDHPVVIASAAHFDFVEIHPFVDGNGRVARLLMNLILMHFGYPPAIVLMSRRRDYIESIVQIQNHHNFVPFNILLAEALEYTMEKYLGCLKRN
jgi:Fic family protein